VASKEEKMSNLRISPWFKTLLFVVVVGWSCLTAPSALGATGSESCSANQESRQMDFWLGDWTVTYPGMPGSANSKVYVELDKCLIVESWDGGKDHKGENMFACSFDDKSWHGMFADNQGHVHVFEGKVANGTGEFTGPSRDATGEKVLNRIKIVRVNANKVEQSWEKSRDNGATWNIEFQGEYTRKNP
jgi:hypothetical protein